MIFLEYERRKNKRKLHTRMQTLWITLVNKKISVRVSWQNKIKTNQRREPKIKPNGKKHVDETNVLVRQINSFGIRCHVCLQLYHAQCSSTQTHTNTSLRPKRERKKNEWTKSNGQKLEFKVINLLCKQPIDSWKTLFCMRRTERVRKNARNYRLNKFECNHLLLQFATI